MGDALPAPAGGMHGVEGMGLELVRDPVAVTVAGGGGSASTMSPHHPNRQHHALAAEALAERAGLQLDSGGNVIGVISGVDGDADGVVGVAAATALGDHRHDAVLVTEVVDVTPQPRARPRINAKTLVDCTRLPTVPLASSTAAVATDPAVTAESTEVHASQPVSEPRVQARPTTTATTAVSTPVSTRTGTSPDVPRPRPAPRQRVHTVAAIDRSSLKAHHQHAVDPATRRVVIKLPGAASGKVDWLFGGGQRGFWFCFDPRVGHFDWCYESKPKHWCWRERRAPRVSVRHQHVELVEFQVGPSRLLLFRVPWPSLWKLPSANFPRTT
eukprot:m.24682 g.24682  ORF g.24682 m.24682 type:complete len:328 (+) comp7567_c0_seq2:238-1221(+)